MLKKIFRLAAEDPKSAAEILVKAGVVPAFVENPLLIGLKNLCRLKGELQILELVSSALFELTDSREFYSSIADEIEENEVLAEGVRINSL